MPTDDLNIKSTDVTGSEYVSLTSEGTVIRLVDLRNYILQGLLQDVKFIDCKIVGVEFSKCDRTFFSISLKNTILQYCDFFLLIPLFYNQIISKTVHLHKL